MYASWIWFFYEGEERRSEMVMEALLAYWLLWLVLTSVLGNVLNINVSPLAILLAKGDKTNLAPLYLDECVENMVRLVGRYDVVTTWTRASSKCLFGIGLWEWHPSRWSTQHLKWVRE